MSDKGHICSCKGDQDECLYLLERDSLREEVDRLKAELEREAYKYMPQSFVRSAIGLEANRDSWKQKAEALAEAVAALSGPEGTVCGPLVDGPELSQLNEALSAYRGDK